MENTTTNNNAAVAMQAAHTPGPWTAADTGIFSQHLSAHGNFYVLALPFPSEEPSEQDKANLALAAAAPLLLSLVRSYINTHPLDELTEIARGVVAKAERRAL